jgi:hypothetical protein
VLRCRAWRKSKLPVGVCVVTLLVGTAARAQSPNAADGVRFDDRFFVDGVLAPTFTRPEIAQVFSYSHVSGSDASRSTAHDEDRDRALGPLSRLLFSEPKGPAKVLRDLLNTPVKDLVFSRAEAESDVSTPASGDGPATALEATSVPARVAEPTSERPLPETAITTPAPSAQAIEPPQRIEPAEQQDAPSPVFPASPQQLPSDPERGRPKQSEAAGQHPAPKQPGKAAAPGPLLESEASPVGRAEKGRARAEVPPTRVRQPRMRVKARKTGAKAGLHIATGRALWYEHPGRTASGEMFNPDQLTAAHHTLPMRTRVRVVSNLNGRSVLVRINDRIPRRVNAVINLARASARRIGFNAIERVSLYGVPGK